MNDLISRQALYNRAATLEAQALDYVGKLIERDGDEYSTEWKIWSAILAERTAFKHDVFDAPSAQPEQRYTEEELMVFKHGISLSLLSKRSSQHWQYDEDTATEIKFLERLYEKVSADMRGEQDG